MTFSAHPAALLGTVSWMVFGGWVQRTGKVWLAVMLGRRGIPLSRLYVKREVPRGTLFTHTPGSKHTGEFPGPTGMPPASSYHVTTSKVKAQERRGQRASNR